jgi:hypothetical protein
MTIVREEENGDNGHHAGGAWRGGRCPLSRDTRAGALARFGVIDRSVECGLHVIMPQAEISLRRRNPRVADDQPPTAGR